MWSQPSNNKQQPTTREATVNNQQQQQQLQFRFECVCVRKETKKKGGKQQGKLVIGVVVVILCDFLFILGMCVVQIFAFVSQQ